MNSYPPPSGGSGVGTLHTCTFEKTDTQFFASNVPALIQYHIKSGTDPAQGSLGPPSYFLVPGAGQIYVAGNVYWYGDPSYCVARIVKIDGGGITTSIIAEFGDSGSDHGIAIPGEWYPVNANDRIAIEAQTGVTTLGVHGDTFGAHRNIVQFVWAT